MKKQDTSMMPVVMQRKSSRMRNLILVVLVFLLGMGTATQLFAWRFSFQATLGVHMHHVYLPWSILMWADAWWTQFPTMFIEAGSAGVFVASLLFIALFFSGAIERNSVQGNKYLHGSARWARKDDLVRAGLV